MNKTISEYQFFKDLCALPFVDAIYLYGSRSRSENSERSDIDIAILCPQASQDNWNEIVEIIHHSDTLLEIDFVRLDALSDQEPLKNNITKDKVLLYKRGLCNMNDLNDKLEQLGRAIDRLEEVLQVPEDQTSYVKDASIQRFEFVFELFWKCLKKICFFEGFEVNSPRSSFKKAFSLNLLQEESLWLQMIEDRNRTSHTYQEELAEEIYHRIGNYLPLIKETYILLKRKYTDHS